MARVPMGGKRVSIHSETSQWWVGIAAMQAGAEARSRAAHRAGAQGMLDEAKDRVHIDSGALHDSGRLEERETPTGVEIDVIFGGEEYGVDYAGYEETLHPYLAPSTGRLMSDFEARAGDYW